MKSRRREKNKPVTPRSIVVGKRLTGRTVFEVMRDGLHLAPRDAADLIADRQVRVNGRPCTNSRQRLQSGQRLDVGPVVHAKRKLAKVATPAVELPPLARQIKIRHLDADILVVDKPAGLTTVRHADEVRELGERARKFLPPTLVDLLPHVLPPQERRGRIRAVHRLDKETSGLLVLARTPTAERELGLQFRAHSIERRYVALVRGKATGECIESFLVRDRGDGRRGSGPADQGQRAVTHVRILENLPDFSLVECSLDTGRTHQVRIHLGERGTPLCGERVYDRPLHGQPLPDASHAERPLLHASYLAVTHPRTGERMAWESPMPDDMRAALKRARRPARG